MNLQQKLKDFAMKISGTSVVDNQANPNSALNKMKKAAAKQPPYMPKTYGAQATQKTYGVPGAK